MKFLYSLGGGNIPVIREIDIDANKKFKKGQVVRISTDAKIAPDALGGCMGVAAEDHTGENDILNERNNGTKLRVDITRDAVYLVDAPRLIATGGSEKTFVCNSQNVGANLSNSKLVLVQKGENSRNTDFVGSVRKIDTVAISGSTATFTVESGSEISMGDVYAVIPIYGYSGFVGSDCENFSLVSQNVATNLYVINSNTEALTLEVLLKKDFIV